MNIYCIIFMCTFGSNNTDTEIASDNSLGAIDARNGTDVASVILPERGEPVPQFGDIVMELPDMPKHSLTHSREESNRRVIPATLNDRTLPTTDETGPTLSEILLPPAIVRKPVKPSKF